ncbi:translation initiation factor eIF-1A [Candidatus Woesearchaeota archaeon]|jgi:translation initiation factor 1A|nr:translation initiation factor eIF-1A [Candidatus Woesearchaeota archaeon]
MNKKPYSAKKKGPVLSAEEQEQQEIRRTKLPRDNQVLGICEQRLGGSRMKVRCMDAKTRVCRIPGRLKRRLWVREGDTLLIEPWEFQGDEKGDVVFKYRPIQVKFLKNKGYLKLDEFEEF